MADKIPNEPLQLLADSTLTDPAKPAMTWPVMSGGQLIGWSGSYYDVARELAREALTLRADLAQARADLMAAQASAAIRQTTIDEAHLVLDGADIDRESADGHTLPLWDRNPAINPEVGDTWTRGKASLQVTSIRDDVVTLTPSGPEIASAPTTWRLHPRPGSVGWAGSVCSWSGWVYSSPA